MAFPNPPRVWGPPRATEEFLKGADARDADDMAAIVREVTERRRTVEFMAAANLVLMLEPLRARLKSVGHKRMAEMAGLSVSVVTAGVLGSQWPSFPTLGRLALASGYRVVLHVRNPVRGREEDFGPHPTVASPEDGALEVDARVRLWHDLVIEQLRYQRRILRVSQDYLGSQAQVDGATVTQTERGVGADRWVNLRVLLALTVCLYGQLQLHPIGDPFPPPLWKPR